MNNQNEINLNQKQEYQVTCPFCSVGCRYKILKGHDEVIFSKKTQDVIDFDYQNPINQGALCPRGHFSYELLSHPKRLNRSCYKSNGKLTPEIPEIIFQNLLSSIQKQGGKLPLSIFFNPLISLHDTRALLDFATNNKIQAIDFIAPVDRPLFRAILETPFPYRKCDDPRTLSNLNYILTVGDIFTKHPILSRHILKAKYAFRQNALFNINPIPGRTSWFSNIFLENSPHTEPVYLGYLYTEIYKIVKKDFPQQEFKSLAGIISDQFEYFPEKIISSQEKEYLKYIVEFLLSGKKSAILYSTHHYNVLGSFISGLLCSALSSLTSSYFIPLYGDGNFNALENLASDIYPQLRLGRKPLLYHLMQNPSSFAWAVDWNPMTYLPGSVDLPVNINWIVSSMVQDKFPDNTIALLSEVHINEQMDLRTNFISWQSIGAQPVKTPIGSAQSIAHYTYLLHQKANEKKVTFDVQDFTAPQSGWDEILQGELQYYTDKIKSFEDMDGIWLIPAEHMAHYKDAGLTQYSSWAQRACTDEHLVVSHKTASEFKLKNGTEMVLKTNKRELPFRIKTSQKLKENTLVGYSHYSPLRRALPAEFSTYNQEYYFWCPKVSLNIK